MWKKLSNGSGAKRGPDVIPVFDARKGFYFSNLDSMLPLFLCKRVQGDTGDERAFTTKYCVEFRNKMLRFSKLSATALQIATERVGRSSRSNKPFEQKSIQFLFKSILFELGNVRSGYTIPRAEGSCIKPSIPDRIGI